MHTSTLLKEPLSSNASTELTPLDSLGGWLTGFTAAVVGRAVESTHGKEKHAENFTAQVLVDEMLSAIPAELWHRKDLAVLDPCCGVGNFEAGVFRVAAREKLFSSKAGALSFSKKVLHLCEIQPDSLKFTLELLNGAVASSSAGSFLAPSFGKPETYDLIFGNPPYEEVDHNGRKAKNHNLWSKFINK